MNNSKPIELKSSDQKIDRALRIAFFKITVPSMSCLFVLEGLGLFIIEQKNFLFGESVQIAITIILILSGFISSWLIWSFKVPLWRLEAYTLVDDIDELKKQAVLKMIIWPEGHIFEKTEIASEQVKEKIRNLEKFKKGVNKL